MTVISQNVAGKSLTSLKRITSDVAGPAILRTFSFIEQKEKQIQKVNQVLPDGNNLNNLLFQSSSLKGSITATSMEQKLRNQFCSRANLSLGSPIQVAERQRRQQRHQAGPGGRQQHHSRAHVAAGTRQNHRNSTADQRRTR